MSTGPFHSLLIANRGEIACRIIRTARGMGIRTIAVYSEADVRAPHVMMADEAVLIGPPPVAQSYLSIDRLMDAVTSTGAGAVHPGYGFLSENAQFARACADQNVTFVGPSAHAIGIMGDKARAKARMIEAAVPCIPGYQDDVQDDDVLIAEADAIGYPVMIKAAAGGGGRGMRLAQTRDDMPSNLSRARSEALNAFGSDRLILEKAVQDARHVEIQIIADAHGHTLHMGERDCSAQRRHQKVVEEAPCPVVDAQLRAKMGAAAIKAAEAVDYQGAGTVEFLLDGNGAFYFLEMNTRLQVEHPVTEMITGVDLVEQMLRSAYGEKLALKQKALKINGWAIESRVYAEDPYRNFLPSIGRLKRFLPPREGRLNAGTVRMDSGVREGDEISMFYDPMIAKLVTHGATRDDALDVQAAALDRFHIKGIRDNIPFCAAVMDEKRFRSGNITTAYIKDEFPDGFQGTEPTAQQTELLIAAAAFAHGVLARRAGQIDGRLSPNTPLREDWVVVLGDRYLPIKLDLGEGQASVEFEGKTHAVVSGWVPGNPLFEGVIDGEPFAVKLSEEAGGFQVRHRGVSLRAIVCSPVMAELHQRLPEKEKPDLSKLVISPMPGLVVSIDVEVGQTLQEGEAICIVEAMKMQNIIRAEADGTVKAINVSAGDSVAADEVMVEFE